MARKNRVMLLLLALLQTACDGTSPASLPAIAQEPKPAIVLMGDSIEYYWDFSTPTIAQLLPDANDAGVPGNTTAAMLERFQAAVIDMNPQTVVIKGGTNDLLTWPGTTDTDSLQQMVIAAQAAGIRVLLCTIPPSPILNQPDVVAWNQAVRDLAAAYGVTVIDYASAAWTSSDWKSDNEHPNDAGYALMWPLLQEAVQ